MFVMIMTEIHAVIERHIIFMVRRWQELLITGKRFAYPKRPFIITRSAYAGAQRYSSSWTGDNVATWEHLWIANIQVKGCQFLEWDLLALISVDSQNNLQVIYMRGGFNWVFFILLSDTLFRGSWRSGAMGI
jgi:hypothetical protein